MKKVFIAPEMEISKFNAENVVTGSNITLEQDMKNNNVDHVTTVTSDQFRFVY